MTFLELLIVALAVILGSLVKGTTGRGLPLTAVPVIAFFVGVLASFFVFVTAFNKLDLPTLDLPIKHTSGLKYFGIFS